MKLRLDAEGTKRPVAPDPQAAARRRSGRACPKCRVALTLEGSRVARGLAGPPSEHEFWVCPACDTRFHFAPATGKWRELTE